MRDQAAASWTIRAPNFLRQVIMAFGTFHRNPRFNRVITPLMPICLPQRVLEVLSTL